MKLTLPEDLVCPCSGNLELTRALEPTNSQDSAEIISGWLRCGKCGENFPITRGDPRILVGPLRSTLQQEYSKFFADSNEHLDAAAVTWQESKLRTMPSFGYEWRHLSDFRWEGEGNFRCYFAAYPPGSRLERSGKSALVFDSGEGNDIVAPRIGFDYST